MNKILSVAVVPLFLLISLCANAHEGYDKAIQAYSCVDYPKALSMFKQHAGEGHALSQYMVGIMLEQGQGAEVDAKSAFNWYMKSAQQGIADSYFAVGDLYSRGIGVAQDTIQAYAWFMLADRGGHRLAKDMMESLASNLNGDQIAKAREIADSWVVKVTK